MTLALSMCGFAKRSFHHATIATCPASSVNRFMSTGSLAVIFTESSALDNFEILKLMMNPTNPTSVRSKTCQDRKDL